MSDISAKESIDFGAPIYGSGPHGYPTVPEFARAVRKSTRWVRGMMARGLIRYTTVGRTPYPHPLAGSELMAANERPAVCVRRRRG
jgi:hypothetical protein